LCFWHFWTKIWFCLHAQLLKEETFLPRLSHNTDSALLYLVFLPFPTQLFTYRLDTVSHNISWQRNSEFVCSFPVRKFWVASAMFVLFSLSWTWEKLTVYASFLCKSYPIRFFMYPCWIVCSYALGNEFVEINNSLPRLWLHCPPQFSWMSKEMLICVSDPWRKQTWKLIFGNWGHLLTLGMLWTNWMNRNCSRFWCKYILSG
jgi:hypothetical protein